MRLQLWLLKVLLTVVETVDGLGDETCGMQAVNQMVEAGVFEQWFAAHREKASLTILLANPQATRRRCRFIDENLNRLFLNEEVNKASEPGDDECYEKNLIKLVADEIDRCDVYLDLHSTSAPSPPFALATGPCSSVMSKLPVRFILHGILDQLQGTSLHWSGRNPARQGAVVECGQHSSSEAIQVAEESIRVWLGMAKSITTPERKPHRLSCVHRVPLRAGFQWADVQKPAQAFDWIPFDTLLGSDDEVGDIRCPFQPGAYVIMPTAQYIIGEEVCFWGVDYDDDEKHSILGTT